MKNVRIWFKKTGAVKYISHLDLTRCMSRALRLSGLPVWYTEGFNPRVYMTFAMPLSLGVTGLQECMDIRLTQDVPLGEIAPKLNAGLPQDLVVFDVTEPVEKFSAIQYADYELRLETEDSAGLAQKIQKLLERDSVTVLKHGKKGDRETEIKPFFSQMEVDASRPDKLTLSMRLPCSSSGSVAPGLLLEALERYQGIEAAGETVRKRLLTEDFSEIR